MDSQNQMVPVEIYEKPQTLNKIDKSLAVGKGKEYNPEIIPHLSADDVRRMAELVNTGKHGERNRLLIITLFDGCLRVSECLRIRPGDIDRTPDGYVIKDVIGKSYRKKYRIGNVAVSSSLANQLMAYAYHHDILKDKLIFPISRIRVYQIVDKAMIESGIVKPEHVGAVHVLRHTGCLERLKATGNPKSVQDQLRHRNTSMTLRYMKTLSNDESLKIQQGVDFRW